jgi:hypothetical protein
MNAVTALPQLASRINVEHEAAGASFKAGLLHARAAGELLLQAKGQLPHGQWLPWMAANVHCSERTAQAYMRVAKRWDELEAKAQGLADLTFEGGLKLLAAPAKDEDRGLAADMEKWSGALAEKTGEVTDTLAGLRAILDRPDVTLAELVKVQETAGRLAAEMSALQRRAEQVTGFRQDLPALDRNYEYVAVAGDLDMMEITPNPDDEKVWFVGVYKGLRAETATVDYFPRGMYLKAELVPGICEATGFTPEYGWLQVPFDGKKPWYITDPGPRERVMKV